MSTQRVVSAKVRKASYWTSTSTIALAFLSGGVAYLGGADEPVRGMAELGYPAYFVTILGVWKALGAIALVAPRCPRLKEWAYAGIAFDLIGAAASHAAVGHPMAKVIVPLILLAIMAVSWALRPASRTLAARPAEPESSSGAQEPVRASGDPLVAQRA